MHSSRLSVLFLLLLTACGDDDGPPPDAASPDGGNDTGRPDGARNDGDGGGMPVDPLVAVPPMRFEATAMDDCPAAFRTTAPVDGANDGFMSAGQTRSFELMLPTETDGPTPLFVAFNGTGESGLSFSRRADLEDFVARGFIVVAPDSVGNGTLWPVWDGLRQETDTSANADVTYVGELVSCLAAHFDIDAKRIYAGGHSAGGIMTNRTLRERSDLFAGGIVGSGVWSLTDSGVDELESMIVLVTWGGANDAYSGEAGGGVSVPVINFVAEAASASKYYEDQPNVAQAWCHGDDLGHAWLSPINDWMIDLLLAYPKGLATDADPVELTDPGSGVTCGVDAAPPPPRATIECPGSGDCQTFCQNTADCVVTNPTAGPILGEQLTALGFSGIGNNDCSGCVGHCEDVTTTAQDDMVLDCLTAIDSTMCGAPGVEGVLPWVGKVNECCNGRSGSPFCHDVCDIILTSTTASTFFTATCESLGG